MRVLTLWQPWASLLATGAKLFETRSWQTDYRGPVAVHAALAIPPGFATTCVSEPFASALARAGYDTPADLPRGALLGVVDVVGCLLMRPHRADADLAPTDICIGRGCDPRLTTDERAFGIYDPGRYAWVTFRSTRRVLLEPLPYRGGQGLRRVPEGLATRLLGAPTRSLARV